MMYGNKLFSTSVNGANFSSHVRSAEASPPTIRVESPVRPIVGNYFEM